MSASRVASLIVALLIPATLSAQEHAHPRAEKLGAVHFPTSCAPAVTPTFNRAIALLHSFEFGAAISAFEEVLARDSTCAVAWWGIALSRWTNPMVPDIRPRALLERGWQAAHNAARLGAHATERERAWIAAVGQLYAEHERVAQQERIRAYERAMARVSAASPDDVEARIFHAIALVAIASPADKTYTLQLQAGAMLEQLFAKQPDHPGLAHYIIHSYDVPALAARASNAALRYADIAPSASHALHMPSHAFTRVGMWRESVKTNLRSLDEAVRTGAIAEALHAMDYAVYANLQMRRDSAVQSVLRRIPELAARFDPEAVTGAAPGSAGVYALAAIPARYALEREDWAAAAALQLSPSRFAHADALTHFARALGFARLGRPDDARASADSLALLSARLKAAGESYWAEQVAIQHLAASAWVALGRKDAEAALRMMREAATREDATEKAAVSPGPLAPARELLADMLHARGRHAEAVQQYRASLSRDPSRYRSLSGAVRSAEALRDTAAAAEYRRALAALVSP